MFYLPAPMGGLPGEHTWMLLAPPCKRIKICRRKSCWCASLRDTASSTKLTLFKAALQDPVVTRCKHYFCEQCALKRNAKKGSGGRCAVCEAPTGGIFNVAHNIARRVEDQRRSDDAAGSVK